MASRLSHISSQKKIVEDGNPSFEFDEGDGIYDPEMLQK